MPTTAPGTGLHREGLSPSHLCDSPQFYAQVTTHAAELILEEITSKFNPLVEALFGHYATFPAYYIYSEMPVV